MEEFFKFTVPLDSSFPKLILAPEDEKTRNESSIVIETSL
jgi:hypothetical protein